MGNGYPAQILTFRSAWPYRSGSMNNVTQILKAIENGDRQAADDLLPLVYEDLRRLAAQQLSRESSGLTLQPTALVHEAYVRLVDNGEAQEWDSRGHLFSAAAEAMRRILVENARSRKTLKRGGHLNRVDLDGNETNASQSDDKLLALDESLRKLADATPSFQWGSPRLSLTRPAHKTQSL